MEWLNGDLFPKVGFIVTNSKLRAGKVVKVSNRPGDVENRIKEGRIAVRRDKTVCYRFPATEARVLMRVFALNLLRVLRQFYHVGAQVKLSMESLIKLLIKEGAKVAYQRKRWQVRVASVFPLARYYRAVFG